MVMVSPSLIEKDREEDYIVSNEKAPSKIHIWISTYAFGEKVMWSLLFEEIDSEFAQCTVQGTQRRKN